MIYMFVNLIALIVIIAIFMLFNIKNKYAAIISLYLTVITFLLFIGLLYLSKLHYYTFPLRIDYILYLHLSRLPLSFSRITQYYNLGFALFMIPPVCIAKSIAKVKLKTALLLCIPMVLFLLFISPETVRRAYVYQHTSGGGIKILTLLHGVCIAILIFYAALPALCLVKVYKSAVFKAEKRDCLVFALCIAIIYLYFCFNFIFGTFRSLLFCNVTPAGIPIDDITVSSYLIIPMITFIVLIPSLFLLILCKPLGFFSFEYTKNKAIRENAQQMNDNICINLHMYKNMICGSKQQFELIKAAMRAGDYESIIGYADDGIEMTMKHLERVEHNVNAFSRGEAIASNIDIAECMDRALEKVKAHSKVTVTKNYITEHIITYGNKYIITEAFANIINNSIESFENYDTASPEITITLGLMDKTCMIEITDNGCGIPRKNLKHIFEPFYSTKSKTANYGIGLNYVKKIIKIYRGRIAVLSVPGKYTTFRITIPVSSERSYGNE